MSANILNYEQICFLHGQIGWENSGDEGSPNSTPIVGQPTLVF